MSSTTATPVVEVEIPAIPLAQLAPWAYEKFVEIPRAVHTLHEDNPEAVLAVLREFLGF